MVQIMMVNNQLSINVLPGLQSNLAEGVWEEKVGKARKRCCMHNARNSCFVVA